VKVFDGAVGGRQGGRNDAEGRVIVDPEDFTAAGGHAQVAGEFRERGGNGGWESRCVERWGGGRLGLESDADDIERSDLRKGGVLV
jgi:hypothetical protein